MPTRQKIFAYLWLLVTAILLGLGHFLFFHFGFHELNPFPITRGLCFASTLWSTALLIAMVLRHGWARYVLIAWLVVAIAGFSMATLFMNSRSAKPVPGPTQTAVVGLVLYTLALIPLGAARPLRRFLAPRTAGGH